MIGPDSRPAPRRAHGSLSASACSACSEPFARPEEAVIRFPLATLVVLALSIGSAFSSAGPAKSALSAFREANQRREDMPTPRHGHSAVVVEGKIVVIGGFGANNAPLTLVEEYDPATDAWASRASMPTPRGLFGASSVGGTIYAIGGTMFGPDKLVVVEAYDPETDTWTTKADLPTPRNAVSTSVVDGKIYAIGAMALEVGSRLGHYDVTAPITRYEYRSYRSASEVDMEVDGTLEDWGAVVRSGPRIVDSVLSEISTGFQAAVFTATCSKYTASGVRRSSAV